MKFIKKNIILFSVLLIAVIVSCVFIYLVINETSEMTVAVGQVANLKKKINELNKKSPIPSEENYERITADTNVLKNNINDIHQVFGKPYKKALDTLIKTLGITREEFINKWRKTYEEETKKNSPNDLIFNRFFATFDQTLVDKALNAFTTEVILSTSEPINAANRNSCIMEALGVPRKMEPIPCKRYMMAMQDNLVTYMTSGKCANCGEIIPKADFDKGECRKCGKVPGKGNLFVFGSGTKDNTVQKLTFEKFDGASLPRPDEVSYIFKHLELIDDLLRRIKSAGIKKLNSISKDTLKGKRPTSGYMVFTYTIEVSGHLDSIRNLINELNDAYVDNRIYKIKTMTLKAKEDARAIVSGVITKKITKKITRRNVETNEEPDTDKPGVPIIGTDDTVTAEIKLDYVIYIGDELTEND